MIEKNLGNFQRVLRFLVGLVFGAWALSQPGLNLVEWFVIVLSLCLIANGIFSRCYLWYLLDINDHENGGAKKSAYFNCSQRSSTF
jgi:hypothetical protein